MFCPYCQHQMDDVRCPNCFKTFNAPNVELMELLVYLRNRLEEWVQRGFFTPEAVEVVLAETAQELAALRAPPGVHTSAGPPLPSETRDTPDPSLRLGRAARRLPGEPAAGPSSVPESATPSPPSETRDTPAPSIAGLPSPRVRPRPRLTAQRVGAALLSERTLNTLLVVGALLILASASVISTLNPTHLPPLLHFGALVATTLAFFLASYALRTRFGLQRTASALLNISAVFVPLDVWTLGQDRLLRWTPDDVWLVASALCLLAYLLIHALLCDRIFALLTTAAGAGLVLALAHRAHIPLEWWGCVLVLLALLYVVLAPRVRTVLPLLAWALLCCGHLLTLLALTLLTVPSSAALLNLTLNASAGDTLAATWWLGTLFYVAYRKVGGGSYYTTVAASLSAVSALVTVLRFPILGPWTGVAIAGLACVYGIIGFIRYRRAAPPPLRRMLLLWPYHIAVVLSVVALLWPASISPGGAATDGTLAALSRAITEGLLVVLYAYGARRAAPAVCAAVSAGLLPAILANLLVVLPLPNPLITWTLFAAVVVAGAEAATHRGKAGQQQGASRAIRAIPLPRWRSPFALPLFAVGYCTGAIVLGFCLARYAESFGTSGLPVRTLAVVLAMGLLALGALVSGLLHRQPLFLQLAAWIVVAPYLSLATLFGERAGWANAHAGVGWAVMALALVYLLLAALLDGRLRMGARVLYPPAYALSAAATVSVSADRVTFAWLFGLTLALSAWSAWLVAAGRHQVYLGWVAVWVPPELQTGARGLFSYLCAWLLPLWLLVAFGAWLPNLSTGQYGLTLTLLVPAYLAGWAWLTRVAPEQAMPWAAAGILLSIVGPLLTLTDPWPRLAAAALSLATFTAAALVSRRSGWAYGIVLALPYLTFALLDRLPVAYDYYPLSFLPVVVVCLVAAGILRVRTTGVGWSRPFFRAAYSGLVLLLLVLAVRAYVADAGSLITVAGTALTYSLVLTAYVWRQRERPCVWFAVGFALVTVQGAFNLWQVPPTSQPAYWALIGFSISLLHALVRLRQRGHAGPPLWSRRVEWTAATLAILCPLGALWQVSALPSPASEQAFAWTLAIVGLQLITWGLSRRDRLLVYLGVAGVLCAYLVQLLLYRVTQPQFVVVPVGAYLFGVTYAEWRIAPRRAAKGVLETSSLVILLGTSLLQAVGILADRTPSSVYDLIIIGEGTLLLALGAALHWKRTLSAAAVALGIDAVLIAIAPLRALNTWYVVAIVGLALIGTVMVIEKKRQGIVAMVGHWRRLRETWD
jgi:hypothetical protein